MATIVAPAVSTGIGNIVIQWQSLTRPEWTNVKQRVFTMIANETSAGEIVQILSASFQENGF